MKMIEVKTGFGYFVDSQGHIIALAELPEGTHPLNDGFTYVEVADKAALDAIEIYVDPADITKAENRQIVDIEIRRFAIVELIKDGKLPPDYTE